MNKNNYINILLIMFLTSCSTLAVKTNHSNKDISNNQKQEVVIDNKEKTPELEKDPEITKDKETQSEKSDKVESPLVVKPKEEDLKNLAFLRFNIACWDLDNSANLENDIIYEDKAAIVAITDSGILINDEQGNLKTLPPLCLIEADEKFTNIPYEANVKFSFECLFKDVIVEGSEFNYVEKLSQSMLWLIDLKNGQNVIINTKLCQLFNK